MRISFLWDEELDQFERDGFLVARSALQHKAAELNFEWKKFRMKIDDRKGRFVYTDLPPVLRDVPLLKCLQNAAADILGTTEYTVTMNRLLLKDREFTGPVTTHQDYHYFIDQQMLAVFAPLAAVGAHDGPLTFIRGSHKHALLPRGTIVKEKFPTMELVTPTLDVGDIVFMDLLTWHESQHSLTANDRPILQICFLPDHWTDRSRLFYPVENVSVPEGAIIPDL